MIKNLVSKKQITFIETSMAKKLKEPVDAIVLPPDKGWGRKLAYQISCEDDRFYYTIDIFAQSSISTTPASILEGYTEVDVESTEGVTIWKKDKKSHKITMGTTLSVDKFLKNIKNAALRVQIFRAVEGIKKIAYLDEEILDNLNSKIGSIERPLGYSAVTEIVNHTKYLN